MHTIQLQVDECRTEALIRGYAEEHFSGRYARLGLLLALRLNPELYVLVLMMPVTPIILGLHALAAAPHRGNWPFALSGSMFLSWTLLAVFPLQ